MTKTKIATTLAVIFAVTAAVLCHKLLLKHVTGSSESAWFEAGCTDDAQSGGADCAAVLASPYSYWPPKKDGEDPDTPHVPVAFVGLVYYSVLAVWIFGIGSPTRDRRWVHALPTLLVGMGLAGSAYFTFIMFTRIDEWCPWCLVTHALNLALAVCIILTWPRKPATLPQSEEGDASSIVSAASHPSSRLIIVTILAIVLVAIAEDRSLAKRRFIHAAQMNKQGFDQCMTALNRLRHNSSVLVNSWQNGKVYDIPVNAADPARLLRPDTEKPLQIIVFSDFECPACKALAAFIDARVAPLFDHNLKVVFKHYPLNVDCNPYTKGKKHPSACLGAQLAEAARIVGGNDAFWKTHDFLFQNQKQLKDGRITVETLAADVGLDAAKLQSALASDEIAARIKQTAQQARAAGLTGTPSLYLTGRRVDPVIRGEIRFWDRIADGYWKSRKLPRPKSTRLPKEPPTPSNPGRRADP